MSQTKALYRLQKLDLDIDNRRKRIREIEETLENDTALREAQAAAGAIQEKLRPAESRVTDLNLEMQTVSEQTKQLTERLYGGTVSNPKELEDIQSKIAERKRRHGTLEEDLLETMIAVEEFQAVLIDANQYLSEVETAWNEQYATLTDESKRLKQELKSLKIERKAAEQDVNAENLDRYRTLRAEKRGHAVSVLQGESCSMCRVGQTSNIVQQVRQGQDIILCSSCGRILVAI